MNPLLKAIKGDELFLGIVIQLLYRKWLPLIILRQILLIISLMYVFLLHC